MEELLKQKISEITPADSKAIQEAAKRQECLAKPPRSLGKLEEISIQLAGITGKVKNKIEKKRVIVLAADNGLYEEGIASTDRAVTMGQAVNMTKRLTGMSVLAKHFGDEVCVVDMGIYDDYDCPGIINRSLGKGTANFVKGPAMTREQAVKAILTGFEMAEKAKAEGVDIIGVGEMGIGNTSTSSAVLCSLTDLTPEQVTGRGAGLTDAAFLKKKEAVAKAIEINKPDKNDAVDVLAKVGGFDIAAMCGVFLGAAKEKLPVVIDGFISIVAALAAYRICPDVKDYMFPSHESFEIGYLRAAEEIGLSPYLNMGMRLGEGSGCPLAFEIISAACAVMNDMACFGEEANFADDFEEVRQGDCYSV